MVGPLWIAVGAVYFRKQVSTDYADYADLE